MEAIFYTIREQNGKIDPDKTMELLKKYKSTTSPRGEFSIDPETRDVINPEYLREVRKVNGKLANVEIETLSTGIKDPMKEFDKKK
jgi:branched-chain amino acid transport system substrate-binding protein